MNIHSDFQILIISGRDHLTAVIQVLDLTLTLFSVLMNKMNIQMMLVMYWNIVVTTLMIPNTSGN